MSLHALLPSFFIARVGAGVIIPAPSSLAPGPYCDMMNNSGEKLFAQCWSPQTQEEDSCVKFILALESPLRIQGSCWVNCQPCVRLFIKSQSSQSRAPKRCGQGFALSCYRTTYLFVCFYLFVFDLGDFETVSHVVTRIGLVL